MEFNSEIKEKIERAKIDSDSVEGLSEKEREILFGKMVDRILDSKEIPGEGNKKVKESSIGDDLGKLNIQELYHNLKPKTNLDIVMLIAYYFYKEKKSFFVGNLLENYKILLIPSPTNPSDLINKNRKKGFLMLSGRNEEKNNLFSITRKGLSYVEQNFKEVKNE